MRPARPVHQLAFTIFFALVTLLVGASAWAQTITTKVIDRGSGGNTGQFTSQAIVNGNPAVAYYNVTDRNLMFARNSAVDGSGSWTIVTVDATGDVGQNCSLAVVNGNPAISYFAGTGDLKYVRASDASGTSWGAPVTVRISLNGGGFATGQYTSLAVINGNPAISYCTSYYLDLNYVRAKDPNGTSWGTPVVLDEKASSIGLFNSLAVVNGNPAVSYYDDGGDLKYVRAKDESGTSWNTPVFVDQIGDVGQYTSLAVVNGNPAISYYDASDGNLKYVRANDASGASWGTPVAVDTTGTVGLYTSLAVVNGNPAISYYDLYSNFNLKYVRANDASGTSWSVPAAVDTAGSVGAFTSLAVIDGNPAISYYGATAGDLKYVRALDASGTTWPAGSIADSGFESGDVGYYTSQAVVNGNPAISYYDQTNGDLNYVRANDASGTSWDTPVVVDATGTVGSFASLAVINGNPAISYYDQSNSALKYVRANDASGTSWGIPISVVSTGFLGGSTSLTIANGNPAIGYFDSNKGEVKYVRALDTTGTLWGAPVLVDTAGNPSHYSFLVVSLVIVHGNPAISYSGQSNNESELRYVRALDASGTAWGMPVVVDTAGNVARYSSLAIVNSNPAISYSDNGKGALRYVRAIDIDGTAWGTPVAIDTVGGGFSSLAVINGKPAISYLGGHADLNYVQADDVSGTSWKTPITLDSIGFMGAYTSLVEIEGKAAISYQDYTNFDLKWATVTSATRALNISTRDQVKGGENVLIGGFIISGVEAKKVIVRAIGPSIAAQGTLQDPVLELRGAGGSLIKGNDNWKDTLSQRQQIEQTPLAPKDDRESAIIIALNPGSYTMVLSGKNGAEGIAVVEAYDLGERGASELANISSRGLVQTADNVMIAGFILGGEGTQDSQVAIRGLGPSLQEAGVTNALADPTLDLRDKDGTRIDFNDNYGDNSAQAAELAAHGLTPKDAHEAGLFHTFAPGAYTVILAGHGSETGIGLVEVYNLR